MGLVDAPTLDDIGRQGGGQHLQKRKKKKKNAPILSYPQNKSPKNRSYRTHISYSSTPLSVNITVNGLFKPSTKQAFVDVLDAQQNMPSGKDTYGDKINITVDEAKQLWTSYVLHIPLAPE